MKMLDEYDDNDPRGRMFGLWTVLIFTAAWWGFMAWIAIRFIFS
jgi:hypothetical protein